MVEVYEVVLGTAVASDRGGLWPPRHADTCNGPRVSADLRTHVIGYTGYQ